MGTSTAAPIYGMHGDSAPPEIPSSSRDREADVTDLELFQTAVRQSRAIAAADSRPVREARALEIYRMLRPLDPTERARRIESIDLLLYRLHRGFLLH
jgi:hypothetical protein